MNWYEKLISPVRTLLLVVTTCSLMACGPLPESIKKFPEKVKEGVRPEQAGVKDTGTIELPTIIAVMPFQNQTREQGVEERFRKNFYNFFSSRPYVDVELAVINQKIVRLEKTTGRKIANLKPQEICAAIGCDGLVFGKLTNYKKVYAGIYSQLGAEAEIWMVNAKTGQEVARVADAVNHYEGGIPLTPLGAIMTAFSTAANVRQLQEMQMLNELADKLVQAVPMPKGAPAVNLPVISELISNAGEGPFGKGTIVRVGLNGEPGNVAIFDIGNFKRGLPMKETQPGVYLGEYAVLPGDNTADMPIIAYLKRPSGPESQWIDASGLVVIDTSAPERAARLRASGYSDRIELSWDYPSDIPDLSGFLVLRSERPLNGYEQLARVELNTYEDRTAKREGSYYYKVFAIDRAGNRSAVSPVVSARLASKGPSVLTGEIRNGTVLSGIYTLKGWVSVPRGASVIIGPQASMMAEKGAGIHVEGKLTIDGTNGLVRLFARGAEKWSGIVVEGGQVDMKGFLLSGAETGLTLQDTRGVIENASITDNETGMYISGTPAVAVRNCWVSGNNTGIKLIGTDSRIVQSVIVRNLTGISLQNFHGEVRENIIIDNKRNIFSDYPLKLDPNYLGHVPDPAAGAFIGLR